MNKQNLQNLINEAESKTLEFKKSIAVLDAAGKTLSGFLNQPEGGIVLIGISNNGKIIGQECNDSVSKKIAAFLNRFQPTGRVEVTYVDLEEHNKKVILLKAMPLAHERPYSYDGKFYEKIESTTQLLSHDHIRYLYLESSEADKIWGDKTSDRYTLDDLDWNEIRETVRLGINANRIDSKAENQDIKAILQHMELMENSKLTNAAMVLFAKNAEHFLPQCKLQLGRFRGSNKLDQILDSKRKISFANIILFQVTLLRLVFSGLMSRPCLFMPYVKH